MNYEEFKKMEEKIENERDRIAPIDYINRRIDRLKSHEILELEFHSGAQLPEDPFCFISLNDGTADSELFSKITTLIIEHLKQKRHVLIKEFNKRDNKS
jgi:hypothetical protein